MGELSEDDVDQASMKTVYSVFPDVIKIIYGPIPDSLATLRSGTRFSKTL